MALPDRVTHALAASLATGGALVHYQPRVGQMQMAQAVAHTMEQGGMLVVEAGTGIGKTFAYLIPALLSGERVLISTATKTLQDQLFLRDIPRLRQALGVAVQVALLKGRSSYLCLERLGQARQAPVLLDDAALSLLAGLERWALGTRTGDLAEVAALEQGSPIAPWVTSTRDNCLGAQCPQAQACYVNKARRAALAADVVVVNHHLFFADLNVRESGVAELLPSVQSVIFDEAHQLNAVGVQFLGSHWSSRQLRDVGTDLGKLSQQHARGFADWGSLLLAHSQALQALHACFAGKHVAARLEWLAGAPQGVPALQWQQLMAQLMAALRDQAAALEQVAEVHPALQTLHARLQRLMLLLESFVQPAVAGSIRWVDVGSEVRFFQSPLDISQAMVSRVLAPASPVATAPAMQTSRKSWIFTSATLGHGAELSDFVASCGLQGAQVLKIPSPFDYAQQAGLYIPEDCPEPSDAAHSAAVAKLAYEGAQILGGRTLVLTTSLRAMHAIAQALAQHLAQTVQATMDEALEEAAAQPAVQSTEPSKPSAAHTLEVLVQGQWPKQVLLERFSSAVQGAGRGAILVACASFWEGVDLPGQALQLLVIDKLPFSSPDDLLLQAQAQQLEAQGKNAFKSLYLPQAAMALKQGAGRLIRTESDRGVLVICDVRLLKRGYGRQLLAALPAMRRLADAPSYRDMLQEITTSSTKGPYFFCPR